MQSGDKFVTIHRCIEPSGPFPDHGCAERTSRAFRKAKDDLDALKSGRERPLDVGKFTGGGKTGHYFINILSAGMGGLVDRYVADASRMLGGTAAYFGASVKALLNARLNHEP